MENDVVKFVQERIKENEKLFTEKELKTIYKNGNIVKKIYLLAVKNIKELV